MRVALGLLLLVALAVAVAFATDRGYPLADPQVPIINPATIESALAGQEAEVRDLRPGAESRIVWAQKNAPAPAGTVLLYLHGFSASSEEIRPVPDLVADAIGASTLYWRLPGHGRDGAAMAEPLPQDWLDSTATAIATAAALGDRVIVIGTSTGAALATRAAAVPALAGMIDGMIFVSPNFRLKTALEPLLTLPYADRWLPMVAGQERGFEPRNEDHARHWTMRYPSVAAIRLGWLMRRVRDTDVGVIDTPVLMLFSDADQVVDAAETRRIADRWGGPVTLSPQTPGPGDDPMSHVIAGDILSPGMTRTVAGEMIDWIEGR